MSSPSAFATLAPLEPLMDKCVHCAFCLPTCPSYLLLGQEMDSPRGRIYLMRAGVEDRVTMSPSVVDHFDSCLGCMACETASPQSAARTARPTDTRAAIERHFPRSAGDRWLRRLLFAVLPYPARLRVLAIPLALVGPLRRSSAFLKLLPVRLRSMLTLAPDVSLANTRRETDELTAAAGPVRQRVGLVTGCVQRAFFGDVNQATARVLAAEGCEVHAPRSQGCCGALALHAGEDDTAREFARALIRTFEQSNVDTIAVNAAGCGSAMKEYGHLLRNDPEGVIVAAPLGFVRTSQPHRCGLHVAARLPDR